MITVASLAFASIGLCAVASPGFLQSVNSAGVPRWAPTFSAALLLLVAIAIRYKGALVFRLLAAFWAVGAACFARPGVRELGLGDSWHLEPLLLFLAFVIAIGATLLPTSGTIRGALAVAALQLPALALALYLFTFTQVVTLPFYVLVTVSAAATFRAATIARFA